MRVHAPVLGFEKKMHEQSRVWRDVEFELSLSPARTHKKNTPVSFIRNCEKVCEQIRKTQAEPQWIVAQRLLSALTIPGFS